MGPLIPQEVISEGWNFFIAFMIGIGFGAVLEQAGFTSSRKLAGMFYGYDTVVLKVFFTGAITAMLGLLYFIRLDRFKSCMGQSNFYLVGHCRRDNYGRWFYCGRILTGHKCVRSCER